MKYSGYAGQVLRINLSKNSIKKEPLQDEVIEKYLGGSGFCAYYLTKEIKPSVKAFDEENKLMFANGPFSATLWPQSSRYSVAAVSPLTDAWGEAHSGGYWCAELKMAGYDGIIIEGISKQPVYIEISDDKVEIKTADHLWGKDVKEATDTIKQAGDYRVVAIGRSGEKKVRFACIMTDYHRAAARCGLGAVMGSKNLKAIAVRSTRGVKVSKPEEYMKVMKIIRDKLLSSPYSHQYSAYGTLLLPGMLNDLGRLPTYNGQESTFKDCEKVDGKLMKKERILKSRACGGCMLRCAQ
ncbi:aldehyde ferredoxin oxidoreductase, partial [Candidatus Woesearchaeota archaeon]|nr:aldehyde ferredoxin oxidoreductase [Candidatus Woesearchaeota archaeon]